MFRTALVLGLSLALVGCVSAPPATGTTGTPNTSPPASSGWADLAAGSVFTLAQGAAQAYVHSHPTSAAGIQAGLTAAQQAFLAWVNAPAGSTTQQQEEASLTAVSTSLLNSLVTQGVKL